MDSKELIRRFNQAESLLHEAKEAETRARSYQTAEELKQATRIMEYVAKLSQEGRLMPRHQGTFNRVLTFLYDVGERELMEELKASMSEFQPIQLREISRDDLPPAKPGGEERDYTQEGLELARQIRERR